MSDIDLCFQSAIDAAAAIRTNQLSPVTLVDALIDRIEQIDPKLNAFCTPAFDSARKQARTAEAAVQRGDSLGPLHGVPVAVKDVVITKGIRTTWGSRLNEDNVPTEDAPSVERLKAAGAIVLGKTNTPEYGWKGATDNLLFGPTFNPWNLELTPGGSSGGTGAAIAAGFAPLGIGTDGGGSIRIPASFCGIYGLKPSFGRIPYYPASLAETLSHLGPMTRTVRDAALMLDVMAGPDSRDRNSLPAEPTDYLAETSGGIEGLRVAWSPDLGYSRVDPEVRRITEQAAQQFAQLGCSLEDADPGFGHLLSSTDNPTYYATYNSGFAAMIASHTEDERKKMDPAFLRSVEPWGQRSLIDAGRANIGRAQLWDTVRRFFDRFDLLLTPTLPVPAFGARLHSAPEIAGHKIKTGDLSWTPFTYPFNLTGQPAATVPCGFTESGLPVGLQIVGRRFDEATVLRASAAFEEIAPWSHRRPPLD